MYHKEDHTLQYAAWLAAGQYEDSQLPCQLITAIYRTRKIFYKTYI